MITVALSNEVIYIIALQEQWYNFFMKIHVIFLLDLSLYEVHRKPHEVVTDNSLISVSPRALHSELMCPICLDLMRNAQTTKEVS